jgi:hypothetical protein
MDDDRKIVPRDQNIGIMLWNTRLEDEDLAKFWNLCLGKPVTTA